MITGFSHVSIVVPSLEAAAAKLKAIYGLETGAARVNDQQGVRLAYVELPNARIELMEPLRADTPVGKFLERNPKGGIHHFSMTVDSIAATRGDLAARGVRALGEGEQRNVDESPIAFIHPNDFLGALVELEEGH